MSWNNDAPQGVESMPRNHALSAAAAALCLLLAGCSSNHDPFGYVQVSGKVTYDDGTLIPAATLGLVFYPQTAAVGKSHARPGATVVDVRSGAFHNVTSHTPRDGLVRGKHKVVLTAGSSDSRLPASLVPPEYTDFQKTPLVVDTDELPFVIKVPKPAGTQGK
jgi:hypothetical protein